MPEITTEELLNKYGEQFFIGDEVVFSSGNHDQEHTIRIIRRIGSKTSWYAVGEDTNWSPYNLKLVRRPPAVSPDGWEVP